MQSHLRVTIDDIDLVLEEDTSISVEMKNPYLNDGIDTYTYQFDVPLEGNRALLGDVDNPDSDIRLTSIEGKPMAIYVDGVLFAHGKVATIEEQTIVDKVSISMTSIKKQLNDIYSDMNLRDIQFPLDDQDDLQIGEMIGDIKVHPDSVSSYDAAAVFGFRGLSPVLSHIVMANKVRRTQTSTGLIQLQALGFSANKQYLPTSSSSRTVVRDFVNTNYAFGDEIPQNDGSKRRALYHNARISYTHHRIDADGKSTDDVLVDNNKYGPYMMLEADRSQSGICFFLMYVIEALFRQKGIAYDDSVLKAVDDMRRVSFFTTLCKYDLVDGGQTFGYNKNFDDNGVNSWLKSRGIKGRLECTYDKNDDSTKSGKSVTVKFYKHIYEGVNSLKDAPDGTWHELSYQVKEGSGIFGREEDTEETKCTIGSVYTVTSHGNGTTSQMELTCNDILIKDPEVDYRYSARVKKMIANADNLPDMEVTSFFDSLWGSFGLRFYYDSESNVVEPYFIRDLLRNTAVNYIPGEDIEVRKVVEKITGVRMRYSAESDREEQLGNIRKGVSDYDTSYDYLVDKTDPKSIELTKKYMQFSAGTKSAGDYTLYVDKTTGNCYRVKINKDAVDNSNTAALQPSMFQVAQYHGILVMEDKYKGISDDDLKDSEISDYIHEITSDFQPLVQNDLRANKSNDKALLAPFAAEDMWNEYAEMGAIRNVVDSTEAYVHLVEEHISTDERYDVSGTDDGNSPLQQMDWGTTITVLRGGEA